MARMQTIERLAAMALAAIVGLNAVASRAVAADDAAAVPAETKEQRDQRMAWWHAARFGMFIHWGLYAVPAGTYDGKQIGGIGEWIMNNASIPVDVYADYAKE